MTRDRIGLGFLVFIILAFSLLNTSVLAQENFYPPLTSDNAVVVYNLETGQVLYSRRGEEKMAPTAATKLLTMMVVEDLFAKNGSDYKLQNILITEESLKDIGIFGDKSAPRLGLTQGSDIPAIDLIKATLVSNANDACNALVHFCAGEFLKGGSDYFVNEMNKKAQAIGANNSLFLNPLGLDQAGMVSTPLDIALIAGEFYKRNDLLEYSNLPFFRFNNGGTIHTKNYLLSDSLTNKHVHKKAVGMIAGQRTDDKDYLLVTATESGGLTYIIVVMGASGEIRNKDGTRSFGEGNAYDDMTVLIPWATTSFGYRTLVEENQPVGELKVALGKDFDHVAITPAFALEMLINHGLDLSEINRSIEYDPEFVYKGEYNDDIVDMIKAPVNKGQVVGTMYLYHDNQEIGRVKLVTQRAVDVSGVLSVAGKIGEFLFSGTMRIILYVLGGLILFYVLFSIISAIVRGVRKINKE